LAFPETIPTQTVNSVAYNFFRTGFGQSNGQFKTADGLNALSISHLYKARTRHSFRIDREALVSDPYTTGNSLKQSMAATLVVNMPGKDSVLTATDADWMVKLLSSLLLEGTPDYSLRWLQGEV